MPSDVGLDVLSGFWVIIKLATALFLHQATLQRLPQRVEVMCFYPQRLYWLQTTIVNQGNVASYWIMDRK
ncbi:unnamed protein product [Macrosiphum euphorbiae]|uniref:Secreted protein n=1 Tax=Macrosiphum euphorbiae TaxID=13131 RepID=A0AAV0VG08_9HEMI|nr:unnamed protein product [Macrosiphum euphorbiae]